MTRCTVRPGDIVQVAAGRGPEIEVPDGDEVLIEPVKHGIERGTVQPVGESRIWSKKWGLLELGDHAKKMKIEDEEADLAKRKAAQRKREKTEENRRKAVKPDNGVSEKLPLRSKAEQKLDKSTPKLDKTLDLGDKLEL